MKYPTTIAQLTSNPFWKTELFEGVLIVSIPLVLGAMFMIIAVAVFCHVAFWRMQ